MSCQLWLAPKCYVRLQNINYLTTWKVRNVRWWMSLVESFAFPNHMNDPSHWNPEPHLYKTLDPATVDSLWPCTVRYVHEDLIVSSHRLLGKEEYRSPNLQSHIYNDERDLVPWFSCQKIHVRMRSQFFFFSLNIEVSMFVELSSMQIHISRELRYYWTSNSSKMILIVGLQHYIQINFILINFFFIENDNSIEKKVNKK